MSCLQDELKQHHAFVMYLKAGCEQEYKLRHDHIWPELVTLLKNYGISNYHISLNVHTLQLFASFDADHRFDAQRLKQEPIMQNWWQTMSSLMLTQESLSTEPALSIDISKYYRLDSDEPATQEPLSTPLRPMFYLP